jgi:secreted protein with Ig-like and vWFA domain
MGQTAGFAAGSWIVRQAASQSEKQKLDWLQRKSVKITNQNPNKGQSNN